MDLVAVAAEGCNCAESEWAFSPLFKLLIVGVLLAGSVVAALRIRRRFNRQPDPEAGSDGVPSTARVGFVALTLPPSSQQDDGQPVGSDAAAGPHDT